MSSPSSDGATLRVVAELNAALDAWCEHPRVRRVRCADVIPDFTNRERTGVSLEHAHGIALSMARDGFDEDHEVPVVVRERVDAFLRGPAYERWRAFTAANAAVMPPARDPASFAAHTHAYTTLGSSHLNLALRIVETNTPSIFTAEESREPAPEPARRRPGSSAAAAAEAETDPARRRARVDFDDALLRDEKLREAIRRGLPSVVLRGETPEATRRQVSLALNKAALLGFRVSEATGRAELDPRGGDAASDGMSAFAALSRTLDGEELSSLARIKFGIDLERAQGGYERGEEGEGGGGKGEEGGEGRRRARL